MNEKKIMNEEDLMVDYAEMTTFNFDSLDYKQTMELHKMTEYDEKPYAFKFGNFDLADLFKSFVPQREV